MNIIEILKQIFNATDEQTTAFSAAMKENNIFTTSHENMDVRYPKMKTDFEGAVQERDAAKATIAELQKAAKGQAELQAIIAKDAEAYQQLEAKLQQEREKAAVKVGLMAAKAKDVPYLTFKLYEKLNEEGKTLEMDGNDNIKGWNELLEGLQTQHPQHFDAVSDGNNPDGYEVVPLPLRKGSGGNDAPTKESFRNMTYEQRVALKQQNETLYRQLRGN